MITDEMIGLLFEVNRKNQGVPYLAWKGEDVWKKFVGCCPNMAEELERSVLVSVKVLDGLTSGMSQRRDPVVLLAEAAALNAEKTHALLKVYSYILSLNRAYE